MDPPNRLRDLTLVINHTEQIGVFLRVDTLSWDAYNEGADLFHKNRLPTEQTL